MACKCQPLLSCMDLGRYWTSWLDRFLSRGAHHETKKMVPCQRIWDSGNNSYHECDLPAGITATCPQGRAGWWELPSVRSRLIARLLLALAVKRNGHFGNLFFLHSSLLGRNHRWSRGHENCSWSASFILLLAPQMLTSNHPAAVPPGAAVHGRG